MIDLWSREHYKSTIITFAKTIQDILASHGEDALYPELSIGIFSHTRPNAKGFLRQIKREFEQNAFLKSLFPDILYADPHKDAIKWSEDDGIIVKRKTNPKEATIEAWGVVDGQPIGKHFNILVYDDIVTAASVTSPDMIAKTTEMLVLSYSLGAQGGCKRFIGTRYHFSDTYREVMSRGTAIPRIYAATDNGQIDGNPVLLSRDDLEKKRRDMGAYIFSCQMMQDPVSDNQQGFKAEWIQKREAFNITGLNTYIIFDPASAKKKTSDYTAAWVLGLGGDKKVRVLDIVRDRLNLGERARLLFDWHKKYKPIQVRYEKYGKDSDIEHIQSEMRRTNYEFQIVEVGGQTSKSDRIKRLIPKFERGDILFPQTLWYTDYQGKTIDLVNTFIEEEYKCFPVPIHDDMLDSLARLYEPDLNLVWPSENNTDIKPPGYYSSQMYGAY